MSLSLWDSPGKWISDPLGYVFLPRAMLKIGNALFPDEWTGDEPVVSERLLNSLDPSVTKLLGAGVRLDWAEIKEIQQKAQQEAERRRREDLEKAKRAEPVLRAFPRPVRATIAYAQAASSPSVKAPVAWENGVAAVQRYASVRRTVADVLRSGQLLCGIRPREGGLVKPGKREWWETEGNRLSIRFECFRLSRKEPFSIGLRDDAEWICISRDSLNAFLARLKSSHTSMAKPESDAIRHLTDKLKQNPDLSKADAEAECKQFGIGQRAFQRVWPKARENADLPAKAPAGRKKRNRRT